MLEQYDPQREAERARHARVRELFHDAFELDAADRARFLDEHCGPDDPIRDEVARLLDQSTGVEDGVVEAVASADLHDRTLPAIDGFRMLGVIGAGGAGTVYRAEQVEPRRDVAIKLLTTGLHSPQMLERFHRESQALATLSHPGITRVFSVGSASIGPWQTPYIAMELVTGRPINEYAADCALPIDQILELVLQVCAALEHAHQRGVIHRDLKPANVLVTPEGSVQVLDFGIARLTGALSDATATATEQGQILGTVAYMSPEQARADPAEIDTRSDVYGIGAIMFELLTGSPPHDVEGLTALDALQVVRDAVPRRPSTLNRSIDADLEAVVCAALDPLKERRYGSVVLLAADIERFRANVPVRARSQTTTYLLWKFARRHRAAVAATVLVALSLVAGLGVSAVALGREAEARRKAEAALGRSEASFQFLRGLLSGVDVRWAQGRDTTLLLELLDAAGRDAEALDDPVVRGEILVLLGTVYYNLFEYHESLAAIDQAIAAFRDAGEGSAEERLDALLHRAWALQNLGRLDDAGETRQRVLRETARRVPKSPLHAEALRSMVEQHLLRGDHAAARRAAEAALEILRDAGSDYEQARVQLQLGSALRHLGDDAGAEVAYQAALDLFGFPESNLVDSIIVLNSLGILARQRGDLALAEQRYREALALRESVGAEPNPLTASMLTNLGVVLARDDRPEEALEVTEQALDMLQDVFEPTDHRIGYTLFTYAEVLESLGRMDAARTAYRDVIALWTASLGEEHPSLAHCWASLGRLCADMDRHDEAAEAWTAALHIVEHTDGQGASASRYRLELAKSLHASGSDEAAAATLRTLLAQDTLVERDAEQARLLLEQIDD